MPYNARPEQLRYANILFYGAWIGIAIMVVTYLIYILGILDPHVSFELIINNWDKSVAEYRKITGSPHGWDWLALLGSGDFINFIGIALLALMTILCYFTLIPGYFKRKDYIYGTIAILEIVVLSLAASGVLGTGGH
jgi:hypothetical protein